MRARVAVSSVALLALLGTSCGARSELFVSGSAIAGDGGGSSGTAGSAAAGNAFGGCSGITTCSTPLVVCGDGTVQSPEEECDDGNTRDGDGCSSDCAWEPVAVSARGIRTCALSSSGQVKCWGDNEFGELGLDDTVRRGAAPRQMGRNLPAVDLGTDRIASAISAGYLHECALLDDGGIKCWGDNRFGGLGLGDKNARGDLPNEMGDRLPEVALGRGLHATAVAAGDAFSCALFDNHRVKCWGLNDSSDIGEAGQLGLGDKNNRGDEPNEMGDALPFVDLGVARSANAIAAGTDSACAILDDGSLKCWGVNQFGQLGQGDTNNRGDDPNEMGDKLAPIQLGSGRLATAIGIGYGFACAVLDNRSVKCWGQNTFGQLGLGDTQNRGDLPGEMGDNLPAVELGAGRTAERIAVGFESACALLDDGEIKCWGAGSYGQLGLGDSQNRGDLPNELGNNLASVRLGTSFGIRALTSGYSAACAILSDARLKCWGLGQYGELGLGDDESRGDDPGELGDALPAIDVGF